METKYIKEIQVNNNSVTAINNCNQIVSWLSSVITEIEETSGTVTISKTDGTQINIPIEQGVTSNELNSKLEKYYTQLEVNDMIEDIKLSLDKFITDERFRMILDINSGSKSSSCGGDCDGGCGGCCGFNTCCLNFLTAFVDNRECCGGITLIDNMGNQINILENLNVYDIVETSTGTYHVTKCDDEFDIVVGDMVIDNGDNTYTVNPGDDRPAFTIDGNHTTVEDNGDGTYTFCNYDDTDCFTIDMSVIPTIPQISKWLIYDNNGNDAFYPEQGNKTSAIPVPGYGLLEFQTIDIIFADVDTADGNITQGNSQHNQYTHNGVVLNDRPSSIPSTTCTDTVASVGGSQVAFPYSYGLHDDYVISGTTLPESIYNDIGLCKIMVSGGIPITDLTKNLVLGNQQQSKLITKTAEKVVNDTYEIWSDMVKYGYKNHIKSAPLLTRYINNDLTKDIKLLDDMESFVASVGEYHE